MKEHREFSVVKFFQLKFIFKDHAGWDGKYKGVGLSSAVYVYVVKYKETNSNMKLTKKGTVL
jgi:hypothetical protein